MNTRWGTSLSSFVLGILSLTSSARAESAEETLLPIERKISSFSIRVTKTGYAHFASADNAPLGSIPAQIVAIHGRTSKDIWMLTDTGVVLQDDGKDIKFRQAKPCGWGEYSRESNGVGTHLYNIVVDENDVHVFGEFRDMNTRIGSEQRATLARDGKWNCQKKSLVPELTQSSGAMTWRAAYNMDGDACRIGSSAGHCTSGPRFAPTHVDPVRDSIDMGILNVAMWMYGPDDGWVITKNELFEPTLYRFNGVAWTKQSNIDHEIRIHSMWGDEQHQLWMIASKMSKTASQMMILRYDGKNMNPLSTPKSFAASRIRGTSSHDIWFGGENDIIYHWDGSRLRQGKLPAEASGMWVSADGVPFFVLPEAIAFVAPAGDTR